MHIVTTIQKIVYRLISEIPHLSTPQPHLYDIMVELYSHRKLYFASIPQSELNQSTTQLAQKALKNQGFFPSFNQIVKRYFHVRLYEASNIIPSFLSLSTMFCGIIKVERELECKRGMSNICCLLCLQ